MKINLSFAKILIFVNTLIFLFSLGVIYYTVSNKYSEKKEVKKVSIKDNKVENNVSKTSISSKTVDSVQNQPEIASGYLEPPQEKIRNIRFVYFSRTAKAVSILGDFNDWLPQPLNKVSENKWQIDVKIPEGRYLYNFLVDGKVKVDPNNMANLSISPQGFKSSILELK